MVHYLTEGDTFNMVTKEVIPAANKLEVNRSGAIPYQSPNLFGGEYESTKSLLSFAKSTETEQVSTVKGDASDPVFAIQWAEDDVSKYYQSDEDYIPDSLAPYKKGTVSNIRLSLWVE